MQTFSRSRLEHGSKQTDEASVFFTLAKRLDRARYWFYVILTEVGPVLLRRACDHSSTMAAKRVVTIDIISDTI